MKEAIKLATQLFLKLQFAEYPRLLTIVFADGQAHIFCASDEWGQMGLEEEVITIVDEVNKLKEQKEKLQGAIKKLEQEEVRVRKALKVLRAI